MTEEIIAYKVWICKDCREVRGDATDMLQHLASKHNKRTIEAYGGTMREKILPETESLLQETNDD